MTPRRSGLRILGYACITAALTFTGVSALQAVVNPPLKQLEQLWPPQEGAPSASPGTSAAEDAGNGHTAPAPEGDLPAVQLPWWACDPTCSQPVATPSGQADGAGGSRIIAGRTEPREVRRRTGAQLPRGRRADGSPGAAVPGRGICRQVGATCPWTGRPEHRGSDEARRRGRGPGADWKAVAGPGEPVAGEPGAAGLIQMRSGTRCVFRPLR